MTKHAPARIRTFLDLCTNHLPRHLMDDLTSFDVVAHPTTYGALVWVPDDPQASSDSGDEPVPAELLAIQLYARRLGCDYVLFDRDADLDPRLPSWIW